MTSKFLTESAVDTLGIGGGGTLHNKRKRAAPGDGEVPATRRGAAAPTLAPQFRGATLPPADSTGTAASSSAGEQLFVGLTFHVSGAIGVDGSGDETEDGEEEETWRDLLGKQELTKNTLERLIHARGGKFVQNPDAGDTFAVIADWQNARVKNLIAAGKYNVARSSWLLRSMRAQRILPFTPADLLASSPETTQQLESLYDEYYANFSCAHFAITNTSSLDRTI